MPGGGPSSTNMYNVMTQKVNVLPKLKKQRLVGQKLVAAQQNLNSLFLFVCFE